MEFARSLWTLGSIWSGLIVIIIILGLGQVTVCAIVVMHQ
jgi:hypothetical protein